MATIVMNMNGHGIGHEAPEVEEYGEEVLCAEWNPQLALAGEGPLAATNGHVTPDLAIVDADVFLKRMYRYQC